MPEYVGVDYLRRQLEKKRTRVKLRYKYYDMKNQVADFNITTPPEFKHLKAVLGWCGKTVDSLADRLCFREFRDDNFDLNTIYAMNNRDILFDSAVNSALIGSCCFIYIVSDADFPIMEVIDGSDATGIIDTSTGLLKEGYAVLERDENENAVSEAYFLPRETIFIQGKNTWTVRHESPYPLLVPIINRPDASRPFGRSRVTRACMALMQGALRTIKRSEVSAEFYSFPQRYVTGLAQDVEFQKLLATISSFLSFTKDDEGDSPHLGQFSQQSMAPFTEQLRTFASLFAGETGLTLDDLGFATDNPSSAEAIKASHENLRLAARKAQRTFGSGFLNAGYLAACVRDNYAYRREQLYQTKSVWEPIFEPDAAMLSGIGDGAAKINQAVPGYFGKDNMRDLTGIDPE